MKHELVNGHAVSIAHKAELAQPGQNGSLLAANRKHEKHNVKPAFDRREIEHRCEEYFSIFDEITQKRMYDMCRAKIEHSRIVASNCELTANDLGLSRYDTDLAWLIGELHDFGRFGQVIMTLTFRYSDAWNHAHFGTHLLFDAGLVDNLAPEWEDICAEDRTVVRKAVHHHSDFRLPDGLTTRERVFCSLIREADQMDIFRTIVGSGWKTIYGHTKEEILSSGFSDAIVRAFFRHELADYSKRATFADYHLAHIALCFDTRQGFPRAKIVHGPIRPGQNRTRQGFPPNCTQSWTLSPRFRAVSDHLCVHFAGLYATVDTWTPFSCRKCPYLRTPGRTVRNRGRLGPSTSRKVPLLRTVRPGLCKSGTLRVSTPTTSPPATMAWQRSSRLVPALRSL